MIGISKLYLGTVEPSDALRYGRHSKDLPSHLLQFSADKKPVVVWNMTRQCNLKCVHCYAQAKATPNENELTTAEGKNLIDDLSQFGAPVMLFSGGEPLMRPDLPELAQYAVSKGMRAVISTNGTLITREKARIFKEIGLSYVGISLDGLEEVNDRFRGVPGAFDQALEGIRNCREAGIKVGLRFTINKMKRRPGGADLRPAARGKHPPGLLLSPGVRRSRVPAHGRGPGPRRNPAGGGPDRGPDERIVRPGTGKGSADRGQPCRRPLPLPAPAERRIAAGPGGAGACCR